MQYYQLLLLQVTQLSLGEGVIIDGFHAIIREWSASLLHRVRNSTYSILNV